jgi:type I restriction enzyme S subunit
MTPEQLKKSILQMAIQGKLVEHRAEEGTAEELYQQIQKNKLQRLNGKKEGKLSPEKFKENEIPFEIPENWKWVRFGHIMINRDAERIPLSVSHRKKLEKKYDYYGASGVIDKVDKFIFNEKLLLIGEDGANLLSRSTPIAYIAEGKYWVNNHAHVLDCDKELVCMEYIMHYINAITLAPYVTGTAQPKMNQEKMNSIPIAFPPFAEQHRIVAKIEELLPYVDRYAASWEKLEHFNAKFPEDMRKSILQYAVQGKLVEQRPEEGTAEELYQKIQAEKQRLIQEGKIKKEKPMAEIAESEIPFDIPESWKWVRLGECAGYAQTKEKISPLDIKPDMWSLDLEDIQKDSGAILVKTMASQRKIIGDKVIFHKGQVLYSKLRPYLKKILVAPDDGICTPELVPFDTYGIIPNYLVYVLKSPYIDCVINTVTYGIKMPRVGTDTMVNLLIPLPPLAEQYRIVAKIEELLPYCDRLVKK